MNGAQALIRTLAGCGVEVCFANPGTSEMHFVAALDTVPEMRGVLCLSEGVVTGAADGYGRMTGRPAAALLHLGPGLGNGLANLHNARPRGARCWVGDQPPITSGLTRRSSLISTVRQAGFRVGLDRCALTTWPPTPPMPWRRPAPARRVATLILPWTCRGPTARARASRPARRFGPVLDEVTGSAAKRSSGEPCVIPLGGDRLRQPHIDAASRAAVATGARLFGETFPARRTRRQIPTSGYLPGRIRERAA